MSDMIELPRNPVDFKIDELSGAAIDVLGLFDCQEADKTIEFDVLPKGATELIEVGFLKYAGGFVRAGRYISRITRTFDGWHATERFKCGAYHRDRALYERRARRDAKLEEARASSSLWAIAGTF